jgi:hypothetical protein
MSVTTFLFYLITQVVEQNVVSFIVCRFHHFVEVMLYEVKYVV